MNVRSIRRSGVVSALAALLAASSGALVFGAARPPTQAAPKPPGTAAATAPSDTPKSADPRTEALVAWLEGFFTYGAGETTVDEIAQAKIPGYRLVRAQKKYTADERANDQCYAALEDSGKAAIVGDIFVDEARMAHPTPVKAESDLDGIRANLKRYFRGPFRIALDPATDRRSWKGVKVTADTGYGTYDMGAYLKADDGSLLILGHVWDRHRSLAEQRRELMKLDETPGQGAADGKITIVEYSDMQCGYCKKRTADWEALSQKMAPLLKIKRYVKSFPLTNEHVWAFRASSAGRCFFAVKPELFFRWKASVYARQEELSVSALDNFVLDFAAANEVPDDTIKACYLHDKPNARVLGDLAEGFALRVRATPTYFVDGVPVSWFLDDLMEEFLRKTYLKGAGLPLPTRVPKPTGTPSTPAAH